VSSYRGDKSTGQVAIEGEINTSLSGKEVLLIDDIYDSGETLKVVMEYLKRYSSKRVRTCVFLEKEVDHQVDVEIDYLGYKVADVFLVGYGLDYNEKYRDLPYICSLEAAESKEGSDRIMLR
ncbi:MAG: hypoxanthine phosphoribosyltransferase, partial [Planctomycetes bacterium]|nr:hypoxanthine phosphoribosyltransferase [Planctomycetota bacterium]